ncbi:MAG: MoxR family ATPase [Lachnospiraceae bacterium]|nr:MoxR family ATPase [Lachnospiraceae bacterium]MDD5854537.1 MoxR family ATPase [Lachnospiraceae bacterium]
MDIAFISENASKIKENIAKVIVGKDEIINLLLTALLADGHVLIEDMPGTGKTKLAKALAASLDADFNRIQFTPDLLPADITGLNIYNQKSGQFEFTKGPVFTNILLADEINRATPRTQSGLLECMEERQVTVDGQTHALEAPFFLIATQNPVETAGTYPLPEAQLDRFMMQIKMGYPTVAEELQIINRYISHDPLEDLLPVCSKDDLFKMKEMVKEVFVHDSVKEYIAHLVEATRKHPLLALGVNPRGTLALLRCAQAYAAIMGRDYVTPDDVKALCTSVFSHRLLSYSTDRNTTVVQILREILSSVEVPTESWKRS